MQKAFKWIGILLGSALILILVFLGIIYIISSSKLDKTFEVPTETVVIPTDSASLAEGKYLATAIAKCIDCHGSDFGGKVFINQPIIGVVSGNNLTSGDGGLEETYKPEDWVRAIRYGVKPDNKGIAIMPSKDYWHMSDEEIGKIIAYVQSVPPVSRETEEPAFGPLGRVLFVTGQLPLFNIEEIDLNGTRAPAPTPEPTAIYGKHLATIGGCIHCHGKDLTGGPIPGGDPSWPPASNLTPHSDGLGSYNKTDFIRALRLGKKNDGSEMNPAAMPWPATALMTDSDIDALWEYLRGVPAVGNIE